MQCEKYCDHAMLDSFRCLMDLFPTWSPIRVPSRLSRQALVEHDCKEQGQDARFLGQSDRGAGMAMERKAKNTMMVNKAHCGRSQCPCPWAATSQGSKQRCQPASQDGSSQRCVQSILTYFT